MTREFLKQPAGGRPSQATIVRTYASVRHFGRWIHQKSDHSRSAVPPMGSSRRRNRNLNGRD